MRGQVHTLEAIVGGLLLLSSVVFALQMTAVTPLSASTSNQHIENQQEASAEGVLSIAAENGALRRSVLYWNSSAGAFHNASEKGYYRRTMPTEFGRILDRSFSQRGIAYNAHVVYYDSGTPITLKMIYQGTPSDNAVSASKSVVLTDGMRLYTHEMEEGAVISDSNFYADNSGQKGLFEVIRVEVVVWRI